MADPNAATLTQLRNIQGKTGRSIAELHSALAASGLVKHGDKRGWLMAQHALGYGDANLVVTVQGPTYAALLAMLDGASTGVASAADDGDPLGGIYSGAKAHLRPLHDAVMAVIDGFGPFEQAPKKSYISLRRKKQFAMLGPATKDLIEIGLNVKDLPPHTRLKVVPPGGMCPYTVRLGQPGEIDADLKRWLAAAYAAAG
ncbi:MAG: DUF4287 domain-containing protein [Rubrivivax sp.]|nr:DUF4287 domain-containing protein [Rubrivivax sp.]MBK8529438.1 DUF4287 domain-containing protein [Rubrivivax sp.]